MKDEGQRGGAEGEGREHNEERGLNLEKRDSNQAGGIR